MRKASFIKITISLVITLAYIYLFGVVGTVKSMPRQIEENVDGSDDGTTTTTTTTTATETQPGQTTEMTFPEYTSLDVSNPVKPFITNSAATYPAGYTEPPIETTSTSAATTTTTAATTTTKPVDDGTIDGNIYDSEDGSYIIDDSDYESTTTTEETTTTTTTTTQADTSTASEEAPTDEPIVNNTNYGTLTVSYTGSGGSVTGDAADILAQVVMGEIGGSFNEEAIKAQAVASYTYIRYYNDNGDVPNVAVRTPNDTVRRCVNEIIGQAIYYDGNIIQAVYGASSAGYTASSKNVWGVDYPYLRSVKCELDALYDPNYGVKTTFTSDEIKNYVQNATGITLEGDPGTWFAIKEYVDNVYVGTISIGGQTTYTNSSGKTVDITGRVLREQILNYNLRSACFEIAYSSDTDKFTFTTYGYGHGVGFSQHGANNLASYWGYSYKDILQFYYPGTEIR